MILIGGQFLSRAGDALVSLASLWLVLDLTDNNPLAGGLVLAFEFLPFVLFGVLGGVLADRWDRRRTMAVADAVRGAIVLLPPLLYAADRLEVWHLVLTSFALSSLGRLFNPARQALIPELVEPSRLVRANAIAEGSGQAAWIMGPPLGGVLIAQAGAANVFYLDAISFFISAASVLLIRVRWPAPPVEREGLWSEAREGIGYLRATPVLALAAMLSLAGTFAFAPVPALLPVLVKIDLGGSSRTFGLLMSCFFVGALVGSTIVGRLGKRLHRGRATIAGIFGLGLAILGLAGSPWPVVAGLALGLVGTAASIFNVAEYSLLQQQTPPEMRGRVFALSNVLSQCLRPPALLLAPLAATVWDVRVALALLACTALAAGTAGLGSRVLRTTR